MTRSDDLPPGLQSDHPVAKVLRQEIWSRLNERNQHFMAVMVGPEGSGKSYTSLKIAETVDPTFDAERVMFDPAEFLAKLQEWKEAGETAGKMVVVDEDGGGIGTRSWYEKDQIKLNKVLQVIRDENMGIIFTVPALSDLDSQARRRLRAFCEMTGLEEGEWAEFKMLRWQPKRDDQNQVYKKYPVVRVRGQPTKIRRMRLSPPSSDLTKAYNARKESFQADLYEDAEGEFRDEEKEGMSEMEIFEDILDDGLEDYRSVNASNGREYIDAGLIEVDYGISKRSARKVVKLLDRELRKSDETDNEGSAPTTA